MSVLKLKNVQLEYDEYGTGDRYLLCCQQNHSKISSWTIDLAEKEGFHTFNITIRGYGQSSRVTEDLGDDWYDIWAQDACDFADAMGIDKFFYTGMSHGAGIGWHICVNHPERLRGFFGVVAGPHSKDGQETGEARMRTINAAATPESWAAYCDGIDRDTQVVRTPDMSDAEYELKVALQREQMAWWRGMTKEEAILNPRKPFARLKSEAELVETLSRITVPTLLLGGMHDPISLPENLLRSVGAVKKAKLILYENATHALDQEHQAEVVADIAEFCRCRGLL